MRSCNHALGEKMAGRFGWAVREWFKYKNKLGDRMIKQLSNSVIAKYCDLSMSRRSIICLSLRLRQIIDLLATDKSQYFAQPRPIIVKYACKGKKWPCIFCSLAALANWHSTLANRLHTLAKWPVTLTNCNFRQASSKHLITLEPKAYLFFSKLLSFSDPFASAAPVWFQGEKL